MKLIILFLSVFAAAVFLTCCSPNRSILLDKTNDTNTVADKTPEPQLSPPTKMAVAELMDRVANAPPDSFLFPCTLHADSDEDRSKLRKLRQSWLSKEQNDRYDLAPASNCICPGICVLKVVDLQRAGPSNFALLALDGFPPNQFSWIVKGVDLTNAELTWASTIPYLNFKDPGGTQITKVCSIELDAKHGSYGTRCSDGKGKKLPPLESE